MLEFQEFDPVFIVFPILVRLETSNLSSTLKNRSYVTLLMYFCIE